ncbi:hypothetical protein HYZ41_04270 [archaeon]|nr:hypothetical protein [archaeon]
MPLEDEMRNEMVRLEGEMSLLDDEISKLHTKLANLMNIRKKKEHDLNALRANFGLFAGIVDRDMQTNLSRMIRESV